MDESMLKKLVFTRFSMGFAISGERRNRMNLKQLEYLEAIYRLKSFSKAAQELFISQPSISNAIQRLEDELEVRLIDRSSKPVSFTPEGVAFMRHVHRILEDVDQAMLEMKKYASVKSQSLRLAVHTTLQDWFLNQLYSDFYERYPQIQIGLLEPVHQEMLKLLLSEEIDLAYTLIPNEIDLTLYETIPIQNCCLYALLPKGHPLERRDKIPLELMKNEHLLMYPPGSLIRDCLEKEFQRLHIRPKFQDVRQIRIIQGLVEQNQGCSFVTVDDLYPLKNTFSWSAVPLEEPIPFLKGFLLKKNRKRSYASNILISYVQDQVRKRDVGQIPKISKKQSP